MSTKQAEQPQDDPQQEQQPQENRTQIIENAYWKTFDETLQALSGVIPKDRNEFFNRAIEYVDYIWEQEKCFIVLKYMALCLFVIVNISSLTLNVINLETRDSSEDYNLSTYVVALVEVLMVYGCFISGAICFMLKRELSYSYSALALVCYMFIEPNRGDKTNLHTPLFQSANLSILYCLGYIQSFEEFKSIATRFLQGIRRLWKRKRFFWFIWACLVFLMLMIGMILSPITILLKMRNLNFVFATYFVNWSLVEWIRFLGFVNNVRATSSFLGTRDPMRVIEAFITDGAIRMKLNSPKFSIFDKLDFSTTVDCQDIMFADG